MPLFCKLMIWCAFSMGCLINTLSSQSSSGIGEIKMQEISFGLQGTLQSIYPGPDGTCYAITSHKPAVATPWSAQTLKAHKLDVDFNYLQTFDIEEAKFFPMQDFGGVAFLQVKSLLNLVYIHEDKSGITVFIMDVEKLSAPHKLAFFPKDERMKASLASQIQSSDGTKFATILNVETVDIVSSFVVVFDENLKTLGQYQVENAVSAIKIQFAMDNAANVLCFEASQNDPGKKTEKVLSYSFRMLRNGDILNGHTIDGVREDDLTSKVIASDQAFYVNILSHHEGMVTVKDSKGKSKTEKQLKYEFQHIALDQNLQVLHNTKTKISNSTITRVKQGEKLFVNTINIKGSFIMENGTHLVIADASDSRDGRYVTRFNDGQASQKFEKPVWQYTGILIMHFDLEGKIMDTKIVTRDAFGVFYFLLPVTPVQTKKGVFFSYFDRGQSTYMANLSLDEEGKLILRKKSKDQKEMEGRAVVQESLVSDGNQTVYSVIDHPRKKAEIMKLIID